uniref:ribosomal protein L24 n=1 Tax=Pachymeniopsis lanceolata TaxID=151733 RepID=UPI002A836372|nr:ribosomal protein L24 [Pachymeniopsis lanceolata]WOL37261.1 ribosomal protein L24 [Pachymeniopsis lanceolata]
MAKRNNDIRYKTSIKTGDTVKIISGKHKGDIGEVVKILPKRGKIILKNMNLVTKHLKPKKEEENGKITKIEAPIHISNIMLYKNT